VSDLKRFFSDPDLTFPVIPDLDADPTFLVIPDPVKINHFGYYGDANGIFKFINLLSIGFVIMMNLPTF